MSKWFAHKSTYHHKGRLPGDGIVGGDSSDEIEKTRQDILLARLESYKAHGGSATRKDVMPEEKVEEVLSSVEPKCPETRDFADGEAVGFAEKQQVSGSKNVQEISAIRLSSITQCEGGDAILIEEIMTSIVLADIAGHRQSVC